MRLEYYARRLFKNAFDDLETVFAGRDVRTILDVGANIGFVTFQFLKRFPEAQVYAFEPNPAVFEKLRQSYEGEARVHTYNRGVGDVRGTLLFNVNANTGTSSFLEPTAFHRTHQARKPLSPIEVETTTLDAFAAEAGIGHMDLLKMDIEGYELRALQGAEQLIAAQAIDVIYTEVNLVRSYEGQPLLHEMTAYLEERGYYLFNLYDFAAQETTVRQSILGNALYLSMRYRAFLEARYGKENCGWE